MDLLQEQYERATAGLPGAGAEAGAGPPGGADAPDVAAALAAEVAALKDREGKQFWHHQTGLKGTVFVEMRDVEGKPRVTPAELCAGLARHLDTTRALPSRHLVRVLPVEVTCFAGLAEIAEAFAPIAGREFPADGPPLSCSVDFNSRAGPKMDRLEAINAVVGKVPTPPHSVNLGSPDKTILLTVMRNVACLAVMGDFVGAKRMNVRRLAGIEEVPRKKAEGGAGGETEGDRADQGADQGAEGDQTADQPGA